MTANSGQEIFHHQSLESRCALKHAALVQTDCLDASRWTRYTYRGASGKGLLPYSISRREQPDGRVREIAYYSASSIHRGKVKTVRESVGPDGELVTIASIKYGDDWTDVWDAKKNRTRFLFDQNRHLIKKTVYESENPLRSEHYTWGTGRNDGNLIATAITDGNGQPLSAHTYRYDDRGNVLEETLWGNLSGTCAIPLELDGAMPIDNGVERDTILRTFSEDGRNLLLSETHGLTTTRYVYRANRSLLVQKLTCDSEKIKHREFWKYDSLGQVIEWRRDNGSSDDSRDLTGASYQQRDLTCRHTASHCVGLPSTQIRQFWNFTSSTWETLSRRAITYQKQGLPSTITESVDRNPIRRSQHYSYDRAGRRTREIDPLGLRIDKVYDGNDNLVRQTGPDPTHTTLSFYDCADRLIAKEVSGSDELYTYRSEYDVLGNKIAAVSACAQRTDYEYDSLGRLAATSHPSINTLEGAIRPQESYEYDALGHCICETNSLGETTTREYTIRGDVAFEHRSDGTWTRYTYALNGDLIEETDSLGITTRYERDYLGRILTQTTTSQEGSLQQTWQFAYDGERKILEVDPLGIETQLRYDGANRLIEEEKAGQRTRYAYDQWGRKIRSEEVINAVQSRITLWDYDVADRVIQEEIEDAQGTLLAQTTTTYDLSGNPVTTTTHDKDAAYTQSTDYNVLGEVIAQTDALGETTTTLYHRTDHLETIKTDPMGRQTRTVYDGSNHPITIERRAADGTLTAQTTRTYDVGSHLTSETHTVLADGCPQRTVTNQWWYGPMGRLEQRSESDGAKITRFEHNEHGQLVATHKPTCTLHRSYDPLGRLCRHWGPGFDDTRTYDLCGRVIGIQHVDGSETTRRYDPRGNLASETLANGLAFSYDYDALDRVIHITLPDHSTIAYTYDACNLHSVSRGEVHCTYLFDQRSLCTEIRHPYGLSPSTFTYDPLGRLQCQHSPAFSQSLDSFDAAGNLLATTTDDPIGKQCARYSYDALDHLTSEPEHTYTYDSLACRLTHDETPCQLNALNQLISWQHHTYGYDANGCLSQDVTPKRTTSFAYDGLDRLTTVETHAYRLDYTYIDRIPGVWPTKSN